MPVSYSQVVGCGPTGPGWMCCRFWMHDSLWLFHIFAADLRRHGPYPPGILGAKMIEPRPQIPSVAGIDRGPILGLRFNRVAIRIYIKTLCRRIPRVAFSWTIFSFQDSEMLVVPFSVIIQGRPGKDEAWNPSVVNGQPSTAGEHS
jgi:hypothetical protein